MFEEIKAVNSFCMGAPELTNTLDISQRECLFSVESLCFATHLPANAPGKAFGDGSGHWGLHPHWEILRKLLAATWPSPSH